MQHHIIRVTVFGSEALVGDVGSVGARRKVSVGGWEGVL